MQHDSASFWADIKSLEERLAKEPDSYLFARLSGIYLRVGLVDDALHTARQGVERYPLYVAGQRALAMACHAKGLQDECRRALEAVVVALPEDGEAQKMLARLLAVDGDRNGARLAFRTALDLNPSDEECRMELEALERTGRGLTPAAGDETGFGEDEIDLEEIEILGPSDEELPEDEEPAAIAASLLSTPVVLAPPVPPVAPEAASPHVRPDPLSTATIAELYIQQGFIDKALDIYRAKFAEDPSNQAIQARIAELEAQKRAPLGADEAAVAPEPFQDLEPAAAPSPAFTIPAQGEADGRIATLEGWLDNIRRMRAR